MSCGRWLGISESNTFWPTEWNFGMALLLDGFSIRLFGRAEFLPAFHPAVQMAPAPSISLHVISVFQMETCLSPLLCPPSGQRMRCAGLSWILIERSLLLRSPCVLR